VFEQFDCLASRHRVASASRDGELHAAKAQEKNVDVELSAVRRSARVSTVSPVIHTAVCD
jgi:hypothetical protein